MAESQYLATRKSTPRPLDQDRALIMRNGNPAKLLVINKASNIVEKELTLPARVPTGTHGEFRHNRMTQAGTFLVAHLDLGKVSSMTRMGRNSGRCRRRRLGRALEKWQHADQRKSARLGP